MLCPSHEFFSIPCIKFQYNGKICHDLVVAINTSNCFVIVCVHILGFTVSSISEICTFFPVLLLIFSCLYLFFLYFEDNSKNISYFFQLCAIRTCYELTSTSSVPVSFQLWTDTQNSLPACRGKQLVSLLTDFMVHQLRNRLPPMAARITSSPCLQKSAVIFCAETIRCNSYFHDVSQKFMQQ